VSRRRVASRPRSGRQLRIAVAVTSTEYGGAEKYLVDLYRELTARFSVTVAIVGGFPGWPPEIGCVLRSRGNLAKLTSNERIWPQIPRLVRITASQVRHLSRVDFDLVHMQYKREQVFLSPFVAPRIPVVWTEHGDLPTRLPAPLVRMYDRNARHVGIVSIADHVHASLEDRGVRNILIRNPIPERPQRTANSNSGMFFGHSGRRVFLYVGRLHASKRIDLLLGVAEAMPEDIFVLAGEGPMRQEMERLAPRNVRFLGHVADVYPLYDTATAVILTSGAAANEGSPFAMLEARGAGLPVIVMADSAAAREASSIGCVVAEPTVGSIVAVASGLTDRERWSLHDVLARERSNEAWASAHMDYFQSRANPAAPEGQ